MSFETTEVREFGRSVINLFGFMFLLMTSIFFIVFGLLLDITILDVSLASLSFGLVSATLVSGIYAVSSIFMTVIAYLEDELE